MTLDQFIENNNITLFAVGDLKENRFDITYTAVSLECDDLFKQLILQNTPKSLWKYLSKQTLMPRMWQQGNTKCVLCRSDSPKRIFAAFYNSKQGVEEDWLFAQKLDKELKEIYLY